MADDNAEERQPWRRRFLAEAKDMVIEEAIDRAVGGLTDGWLGYEGGDDEEDDQRAARRQPARRESFEERLERELAQLSKDAERAAVNGSTAPPAIQPQPQAAQAPVPHSAPASVRFRPTASPRVFGRKPV